MEWSSRLQCTATRPILRAISLRTQFGYNRRSGSDGHNEDGEGFDVCDGRFKWAYDSAVCAECELSTGGVLAGEDIVVVGGGELHDSVGEKCKRGMNSVDGRRSEGSWRTWRPHELEVGSRGMSGGSIIIEALALRTTRKSEESNWD